MLRLQRAWRKYFYHLRASFSPNQPTEAKAMTGPKDSSDNTEISYWHPSYLDWPVLAAFGITFSTIAVSCEALLYYSNRNYGLATSYQGLHYLWTYGPTAILTLIASFWERVAFQAKISAPWCRMLKGPATSQQSVLLDYVSRFLPFTIYTAIKNKDYPVAASALSSLLLRLFIVISTSFIVLSPIVLIEDVEVVLKSRFVNDPSRLLATGYLAPPSLAALFSKDISLPEGISDKYAYVTAETNIQNISQLATTVDAFEGGLHCEPASITPVSGILWPHREDRFSFRTLRLKSNGCEMTVYLEYYLDDPLYAEDSNYTALFVLPKMCDGPNSTYKRGIGIVASSIMDTPDSPINSTQDPDVFDINITVIRANSFICTPFYHIRPVETLRTNAGIQVSPVAGTTYRQLSSVSPWDMWDAHFQAAVDFSITALGTTIPLPSGEQVYLDKYSSLSFELANYTRSEILTNLSSLFTGDNIVRLISSYYQQHTAIFARESLMKDASIPSTGSAMVSKQRLLVQIIPTHIMTGLLLLSVTMVAIIWWWQSNLFLPQNPNTIIGNTVLLAHNPLRLTGIGSVSVSDLEAMLDYWVYRIEVGTAATSNHQLLLCIDQKRPISNYMDVKETKTSTYRPLSLSVTLKSFAFVLIISAIATLEVLLRKSEHNDGIADAPRERSKYQLWTVFPGLLSTLISMYIASVDADTRSQGHLLQLRRGATFEALSLDLVDRHTSTLILEEVRSRGFESLASTLAVAITSLLTIFSASLFFATTLPAETHVQLKLSNLIYYTAESDGIDLFSDIHVPSNSIAVTALLENASYPAFTYEDLAFPGLVLDSTLPSHFARSRIVYNVTVPAVRPDFTNCRLYDASQIDVSTKTISSTGQTCLKVVIHPEAGCGIQHYEQICVDTIAHGHRYFGKKHASYSFGCSKHIWTWGSWTNVSSDDTGAGLRSIHALACNDTLQTVETSVEFIAQTMAVNSYNPPIANYASAVSLTSMKLPWYLDFYLDLPLIATTELNVDLDSFFTIITSSRYAIPASYLGDASKASAVVESIQFHHGIMLIQLLDQGWRYDNRTSAESAGLHITSPVWEKPTVFNATARDPHGLSRVVQDMVSTRVLQSLLAVTLVCLGMNSFLMRNVDALPRSPTTIANWIALLAGGNLYEFLPLNAGLMPLDQISRWYFGQDAVFHLGFRKSPVSGKEALGIYVVSQHSAPDELRERRPSWYKRLWTFVSAKVGASKMKLRRPRPVE